MVDFLDVESVWRFGEIPQVSDDFLVGVERALLCLFLSEDVIDCFQEPEEHPSVDLNIEFIELHHLVEFLKDLFLLGELDDKLDYGGDLV